MKEVCNSLDLTIIKAETKIQHLTYSKRCEKVNENTGVEQRVDEDASVGGRLEVESWRDAQKYLKRDT